MGVTRVRDCRSTSCSSESRLRRLTQLARRQKFHRGLLTRNIPCRYHFFYGCSQRQPLRSLFVLSPQALYFFTLFLVTIFKLFLPHVSIFLSTSINLRTLCSTTGSPRVSLGSGIVTLPVVVGGRASVI